MKHMSDIFRTLPAKKMKVVTGSITNAGLIKSEGGDYKEALIRKKNTTLGKLHRIYKQLTELSDDEFELMLTEMCKFTRQD